MRMRSWPRTLSVTARTLPALTRCPPIRYAKHAFHHDAHATYHASTRPLGFLQSRKLGMCSHWTTAIAWTRNKQRPCLSTWAQPLAIFAAVALGTYAYKSLMMILFQSKLIYMAYLPPGSRTIDKVPTSPTLRWEGVQLQSARRRLRGFIVTARRPIDQGLRHATPASTIQPTAVRPVIIYFQGNAGNMVHRALVFEKIVAALPTADIVAIHTSGYGHSGGRATERALQRDAHAILDFVQCHYGEKHCHIFLYGHSLGGTIATYLAATLPSNTVVRGLVLENTFTSIQAMVAALYPKWLPYPWLAHYCLWNRWPAEAYIQRVQLPILFLSAQKDEIVPQGMMRTLEKNAQLAASTTWISFPHGLHDNVYQQIGYGAALNKFIAEFSAQP
ncbi:hypothetical protein H4R34_001257 [Dimargaris verticillata]|uniref:AB hydrolase-1 domain-containing protein n=1 Tax=Dimargaris verticillata TaxID=2761393 RepID=A0A9W8EF55_9FUNG|nr:hypothetical protein H4R34_001257 [Dimargaris verticillata]